MPSGCKFVRELSEKYDAAVLSYLETKTISMIIQIKSSAIRKWRTRKPNYFSPIAIYFDCSVNNKFLKYFQRFIFHFSHHKYFENQSRPTTKYKNFKFPGTNNQTIVRSFLLNFITQSRRPSNKEIAKMNRISLQLDRR